MWGEYSTSLEGKSEIVKLFEKRMNTDGQIVRVQRRRLDLKLAVLLLRSGYESVDELDVIPMEQFQILFWKQRQQVSLRQLTSMITTITSNLSTDH